MDRPFGLKVIQTDRRTDDLLAAMLGPRRRDHHAISGRRHHTNFPRELVLTHEHGLLGRAHALLPYQFLDHIVRANKHHRHGIAQQVQKGKHAQFMA